MRPSIFSLGTPSIFATTLTLERGAQVREGEVLVVGKARRNGAGDMQAP